MVMTKSSRAMINLMHTLGSFRSQTHRSQEGALIMVMRTLAMMLVGLLWVSNAEAATITGVSGPVVHGTTVVITGTSFGAKGGSDPNKPLLWADFETSINPTSLGVVTAWDNIYSLVRTTGGVQYGLSGSNAVGTWPGSDARLLDFRVNRALTTLYMAGKRRWTNMIYAGGGNSGVKFFRIYADNGGDIVASTSGNGIVLDELCIMGNGSLYQPVNFPLNAWHQHEFLWRQATSSNCSGDATGNGYYEFIQDGVRSQYIQNFATVPVGSANFGLGNGIRIFDNYNAPQDALPDGTKVYEDDLYLDDTWARVMIGNASTFAASRIREVQIPTAWANGSITVQVNRGTFGASASAWLYVIDSTNTPSAGFPITFGGGTSDTTPPTAPQNLIIQVP